MAGTSHNGDDDARDLAGVHTAVGMRIGSVHGGGLARQWPQCSHSVPGQRGEWVSRGENGWGWGLKAQFGSQYCEEKIVKEEESEVPCMEW